MIDDEFLPSTQQDGLTWSKTAPKVEDLKHPTEYYWIRGGNFNTTLIAAAHSGVNSRIVSCGELLKDLAAAKPLNIKREYWPDVNFELFANGYPLHIWSGELERFNLHNLEWAGPIPRPAV